MYDNLEDQAQRARLFSLDCVLTVLKAHQNRQNHQGHEAQRYSQWQPATTIFRITLWSAVLERQGVIEVSRPWVTLVFY